jgi:Tfp pilus assembly protein PilV
MIRFSPRRRSSRVSRGSDDGFMLLESIITISLITVIMTALASFFLTAISSTSQQRSRQMATQLADSAVETIRGLHTKDLVYGRDAASVTTQFGNAPANVQPSNATMEPATDATAAANAGATAPIPTVAVPQTVNNVGYSVNNYLGWCWVPADGSSTDCTRAAKPSGDPTSAVEYLRAVVAVTWNDRHCTASICAYITTTLISTGDNPTFNLNQTPPSLPIVDPPGDQSNAIGDTVQLTLAVKDNTGVPFFTWRVIGGALPDGLAINTSGEISGQPVTQVVNQSVTVEVRDAFNRPATATFSWTILPPLQIAQPSAQASYTGSPISALSVTASGGAGTPYTWSDPTNSLPPGLTVSTVSNRGTVTGTPTAIGVYPVSLTVTDASTKRSATTTFNWTIAYPPIAAVAPNVSPITVGTAITPVQATATGGSGTRTWSDGGTLPAGLSMTSDGLITGTPTVATSYSVTLTVTDPNVSPSTSSATFSWAVKARPTITAPSTLRTSEGVAPSAIGLNYTCPNTSCTITLSGTAPGLGLSTASANSANNTTTSITVSSASGTVYINGTVQASAVATGVDSATYSPSVAITDAAGASASSTAAAWTIYSPPTIGALSAMSTMETDTPSVSLAYTCPNTSCTITLAGAPPGLGLSTNAGNTSNTSTTSLVVNTTSGTVYINGKVQSTAVTTGNSKNYTPTLSIQDSATATSPVRTATWTVYVQPTIGSAGTLNTPRNSTPNQSISYFCPAASCTFSVTGQPPGIGASLTTGVTTANATTSVTVGTGSGTVYLNGKVPSTATRGKYAITVTLDGPGSVSATNTGSWTV